MKVGCMYQDNKIIIEKASSNSWEKWAESNVEKTRENSNTYEKQIKIYWV